MPSTPPTTPTATGWRPVATARWLSAITFGPHTCSDWTSALPRDKTSAVSGGGSGRSVWTAWWTIPGTPSSGESTAPTPTTGGGGRSTPPRSQCRRSWWRAGTTSSPTERVRTFSDLTCERRLVLGPWLHVCPDLVDREPYDWVGDMANWFKRYLTKDPADVGDREAGSSTVLFVEGPDVWRSYESWPPPEVVRVEMYLGGQGRLEPSPGAPGKASYTPSAVTGRQAGMLDPLGTGFGHPGDQHADDLASLCFETAPLSRSMGARR